MVLCVGVGRAEGFVGRKGAWKAGEVASTFTDLGSQRGYCICFTSNQDKLLVRKRERTGGEGSCEGKHYPSPGEQLA